MNAFICIGGEIFPEGIWERPEEGDLIIAADSGYRNAVLLGITPTLAVGDFDSMPEGELSKEVERLTVPAEKDFTDAQLAVDIALKRGCRIFTIVGGLGGRLDHTLSCLGILEGINKKGGFAVITDGRNRIRFIKNTSELIPRSQFRYFSLIAADPIVKGITIEGGKYPLKNATLRREHQFAVSNEVDGNCALVSVRRGGIFLVESKDMLTQK